MSLVPKIIAAAVALPAFAVALTCLFNRLSGKSEERRQLQREGSAVITPAKELASQLGPEALMFGNE